MSQFILPTQSASAIAMVAHMHLMKALRIDSQSDEHSQTIPSTTGQLELARMLEVFFRARGFQAKVREKTGNMIAYKRARHSDAPPVAFMIHMDTAKGTEAVEVLTKVPKWNGSPLNYSLNSNINVSLDLYPELDGFVGQDVLHGPGKAPFGLDDKLGLTHLMTLAHLLHTNKDAPHPPIYIIGRAAEEIGRDEAVADLAKWLAAQGVTHGYTVDGIASFEISLENFNAALGDVHMKTWGGDNNGSEEIMTQRIRIHGVKTHGATAKAERGLNPITVLARVHEQMGRVWVSDFKGDPLNECVADVCLSYCFEDDDEAAADDALDRALDLIRGQLEMHQPLGARLELHKDSPVVDSLDKSLDRLFGLVWDFLCHDRVTQPVLPEDSEGFQGYTNPFDIKPDEDGNGWHLFFRIRDFTEEGFNRRGLDLLQLQHDHELVFVELTPQYRNMGPEMQSFLHLREFAVEAAEQLGLPVNVTPIRGGTGIDAFLDNKIGLVNLGTGYFAPESEKELTSMQQLSDHALWLFGLVQLMAVGE